jgi:hypothetical protein
MRSVITGRDPANVRWCQDVSVQWSGTGVGV